MPKSRQLTAFNYSTTAPSSIVQVFNASGVWVKPAGITFVRVCLWGGGGGGGSGAVTAATTGGGAGAGGGGARVSQVFFATCLPNAVTITIGAGGTGGPAKTSGTSGCVGTTGGTTTFGLGSNTYAAAYGGIPGNGGTNSNSTVRTGGRGGGSGSCGYPRSAYWGGTASGNRCNVGTGGATQGSGVSTSYVAAGASEWGGGGGGGQCGGNSLFGGAGGGGGNGYNGGGRGWGIGGGVNTVVKDGGQSITLSGQGGAGGTTSSRAGGTGGIYGGGGGGGYGNVNPSGAGGKGGAGGAIVYSW